MEIKEQLENTQLKSYLTTDLVKILGNHFQAQRYKKDMLKDWWSIKHLFKEYGSLQYTIEKNIGEIEQELENVIQELNKKK